MSQLFLNVLWISGMVLIWQMGAGLGLVVLRLWKITFPNWLERQLVSTALGWTILGFAFYGLALIGLFYQAILFVITSLLIYIVVREKPWQGLSPAVLQKTFQQLPILGKVSLAIGSFFALMNLAGALAPDIGFDSTWYHLPYAQEFLREHILRIHPISMQDVAAFVPKFSELLFGWSMSLTPLASTLPQLWQWLSGIFLAAATYVLSRRLVTREWSLLAAVLVYSLNAVTWLSALAYIDLLTGFLGLAVAIALVGWADQREHTPFRWLVGVLLGGFLFCKLQSFFFLPTILVGTWLIRRSLKDVVVSTSLGIALAIPWYLQVWLSTGSLLGNADWPPGDVHYSGADNLFDWFLRVHPQTVIQTTEEMFRREAPFVFLLLPVIFFWQRLNGYGKAILLTGIITILAWTYIPVHEIRYGLVIFPLVAIMVAWYLQEAPKFIQRLGLIFLLSTIALNGLIALNYHQHALAVAAGTQSAHAYLSLALKDNLWIFYDHDRQVAATIGSGKVLILVHNPAYMSAPSIDAVRYRAEVYGKFETAEALLHEWRAEGITHLLVHRPYRLEMFFEGTQLKPGEQAKIQAQLGLRYQDDNGTMVWELL